MQATKLFNSVVGGAGAGDGAGRGDGMTGWCEKESPRRLTSLLSVMTSLHAVMDDVEVSLATH